MNNMFQVCAKCGTPAITLNKEAVEDKTGKELNLSDKEKIYTCPNPSCEIAYFTKELTFKSEDLFVPLFYKDKSDNVPICYCSNLTRGEIKNAVKNGSKTIDDVQVFTGKNMTGNCKIKNPVGQCCRNAFLYEIEQALGQKPSGFDFKPCSCCS
ncbi:(2Fe-2S)-binding protein [Gaoshiqia sediminis]|uniref:(2Fe-2S)-binding protein n=1 Tax=Gaoshiqia sediminis TaxID=2986998 RepID=A0AA41YDJ4_9BACT|nr:(2Fe-2S)-binding protein [Gaoshiqia sediminis]MCW0484838.1 (2Fe-2S)-binding protein [Gaoshiqia sediminis]